MQLIGTVICYLWVRRSLFGAFLQVLDDSHGKIRTAVGMAIASIASCDWPEDWPDLMDFLLRYINDQNDINKGNDFVLKLYFLTFTTKFDCYLHFIQLMEL